MSKILNFDPVQMTTDEGSAVQRMCFICLIYSFIISDVRMRNSMGSGRDPSGATVHVACSACVNNTQLIQNKDQVVSCSRALI